LVLVFDIVRIMQEAGFVYGPLKDYVVLTDGRPV